MAERKTVEKFILDAKRTHGDKYDYSLVEYANSATKIIIICPVHGKFEQMPYKHLEGKACPKCAGQNKTTEEFIDEANNIHKGIYNYSVSDYKKAHIKIKIICNSHGIFTQKPSNHLLGQGCPKCGGKNKTTEEFIDEAKLLHGDKYDYSLADYKKSKSRIKIICSIHGVFEQNPNNHLSGAGCPKCDNKNKTTDEFICGANEIHENRYDYSLTDYFRCKSKVKIICPVHGIFEQTPSDHLSGYGCKFCSESKGEMKIVKYLNENEINYVREKTFSGCRNKLPLHFDFYLPEKKILIEYDGQQHFIPVKYFGGEKNFKIGQMNDEIKNNFAKNNNIILLRINYLDAKNINQILKEVI